MTTHRATVTRPVTTHRAPTTRLPASPSLTHRAGTITIHGAVTLRLRRAGWLRTTDARAWLTRTHGGGDQVLTPGEWHWVEPGTHWVVEPLHPRAMRGAPVPLQWLPLPSRWRAWRLVWRHLVDRLRGETAWDDPRPPQLAACAAAMPRAGLPCA